MHIEFTKHCLEQMKERSITEDEVVSTIKYPEKTDKIGNIYYATKRTDRAILQAVYTKEKYIKVVTVYPL